MLGHLGEGGVEGFFVEAGEGFAIGAGGPGAGGVAGLSTTGKQEIKREGGCNDKEKVGLKHVSLRKRLGTGKYA